MGIASNFGDELNRDLYRWITGKEPLKAASRTRGKVLAIGSVLHLAQPRDVVWGSGLNGKVKNAAGGIALPKHPDSIHFKAVRGPLTRKLLMEAGADVPEVYGDPALLVGHFVKPLAERRGTLVFPHFSDMAATLNQWSHPSETLIWNAQAPVESTIAAINASERVVTSALHGMVLADALGVPVVPMRIGTEESTFKYHDYWLGTEREPLEFVQGLNSALEANPVMAPALPENFLERLLASCPFKVRALESAPLR